MINLTKRCDQKKKKKSNKSYHSRGYHVYTDFCSHSLRIDGVVENNVCLSQNYLPQSSAVNVNDHIESLQKKEKADKKMVYKILTTQKNTTKKLAKRNEKEK